MLFPAFLIGTAFGSMLMVALSGVEISKSGRAIKFSALGSMVGGAAFLLTMNWWPPVVGPFVLCPVTAAIAGFLGRRRP
jgi:hypothetical protein